MKSLEEMARADSTLQFWIHRWAEHAADELARMALQHSTNALELRRRAAQLPAVRR